MIAKEIFPSVLFQTPLLKSSSLLITLFTELFLVHFFILLISLGYCLIEGTNLKCKKTKSILLLSILGTINLWLHSFSNIGFNSIGTTMLFSINIVWVFLFFFFLKFKINKLSLIGVFLGLGGVAVTYFIDKSSFIGGGFGILSGLTLAIVIVFFSFIIMEGPPQRIVFYFSLTGCILSGIVLFFLKAKAQTWILPNHDLVITMLMAAPLFSMVLFYFLYYFHYIGAYTFSACNCMFPMFMVGANYTLANIQFPWSTVIGVMMLALGGIIVIMTPPKLPTSNIEFPAADALKVHSDKTSKNGDWR